MTFKNLSSNDLQDRLITDELHEICYAFNGLGGI